MDHIVRLFFKEIPVFLKESWSELRQVSWLTLPQVWASTVLVIIMSIVMSFFIFGVDKVLQMLFRFLI